MRNFKNTDNRKLPAVIPPKYAPVELNPYERRLIFNAMILRARIASLEHQLEVNREQRENLGYVSRSR